MRTERRRRGRRNRFTGIAILGLSLLAPLNAEALDSDLKGSAVFRLEATHGYAVLVVHAWRSG